VGLPELIRYWHAGCKFWAATLGVCSSQVKDLGIWIVARDVSHDRDGLILHELDSIPRKWWRNPRFRPTFMTQWQLVATAPFNRDLEVCVIDKQGEHLLAYPCRQTASGWTEASTGFWIHIDPTHWREWNAEFLDSNMMCGPKAEQGLDLSYSSDHTVERWQRFGTHRSRMDY
jgi:hypothetical protein